MATSGASLRHSFVTPTGNDRASKLSRAPSLPSQLKQDKSTKDAAVRKKKRPSGLFESSSESASEDSADDASPTQRDGRHTRRQETAPTAATATRHHSLGAAGSSSDRSGNNGLLEQRKGLFEFDDDAADSVETLRERVKLRQKKKESEILSLKSELDAVHARVREAEDALRAERKEKDEFAIRMNECQRIIEKRNKQLIKASEKLARFAEQSDNQITELQAQIQALGVQAEKERSDEKAARDRLRREYEEKLEKQRLQYESHVEKVSAEFSEKLRRKEAEQAALHKRVAQLEDEVEGATSRIAESSEYQILVKRCEDAEAISRGLRFQLEKAQNEKKFLKKQLQSASAASASSGPSGVTDLFGELSSTVAPGKPSPTSSVASADLSTFDFFTSHVSPPSSPAAARASSRKASLKVSTETDAVRDGVQDEPTAKDSSSESHESVYGSTPDGGDGDVPPPSPPLASSQSEKTESKGRAGSGSINFFEKLTIKFKRTASSPKNSGATASKFEDQDTKASLFGSSSASSVQAQSPPAGTAPIDIPANNGRKVLPTRPKMYVAKSPSNYSESSDSIFGSDSDSDVSSDGENDDQPPPPPPHELPMSRSPPTGDSSAIPMPPPPPPPLFGGGSDDDADSSSLSDDEESDVEPQEDLRKVILPVPSPPSDAQVPTHVATEPKPQKAAPLIASSSDDSGSESSSDEEAKTTSKTTARMDAAAPNASGEHSYPEMDVNARQQRRAETRDESRRRKGSDAEIDPRKPKRDRSRSAEGEGGASSSGKVNRMNEYMEARARKRQEKLKKREERENEEHKKREEYEKEWERMAQEERERRRKQQNARRTGKRRPSSMKTVRVSQMRHQKSKQQHQKDASQDDTKTKSGDYDEDIEPPRPDRQRSEYQSSASDDSDTDDNTEQQGGAEFASSPPLPPEPTAADTELYLRQQARLRERHELEMKKKQDAEEADQVRGQIHKRIEMWAFGKELLHMILTLDQISSNDALKQCQLMVVQSPDPENLRKAYRNIIRVIHPDKLRGASVPEQLEAKELFTVLNQAFEKFKAQN